LERLTGAGVKHSPAISAFLQLRKQLQPLEGGVV
jgi:hypothetical protein